MRIAIVGCGVGGLASAITLCRQGHDVTLFERFASPRPLGAGLLLQPSGLTALERLGLLEQTLASGARISRLFGCNTRGRTVMDLRYEAFRPGAFGLGIHRAALFDLLHNAAIEAGASFRLSFEVAAIDDFDNPSLSTADGRSEGPFDLVLIGAGSHDRLRKAIAPNASDPLYPWGALWTICPDRTGNFRDELRQRYDGAHKMTGVLPVGRYPAAENGPPLVALFWSLKHADYAAQQAAGLEDLKARIKALWPETVPLLAEIPNFEAFSLATYRDVRPKRWRRGRVLLIGDAAHGTSPQLGQGANLALIDAVTLGLALERERDVPRALALYCRLRRAHVFYYQLASRAMTPAFQSDSRLIAWLRDLTFQPMSRLPIAGHVMRTTLAGVRKFPFGLWRLDKS